jgi:hypothetical protein
VDMALLCLDQAPVVAPDRRQRDLGPFRDSLIEEKRSNGGIGGMGPPSGSTVGSPRNVARRPVTSPGVMCSNSHATMSAAVGDRPRCSERKIAHSRRRRSTLFAMAAPAGVSVTPR